MKTGGNRNLRQTGLLVLVALGMFGFAFALVPLYNVFCEITGLNGRTSGEQASASEIIEVSDREVTIQFTAHVSRGMPWEFRPTESQRRIRVGQLYTTEYYVRNGASQRVTGQAVPSVAPGQAARHLNKVECFCFTQQELDGGEELYMPVRFYVGADLPEDVNTLSLSYTLFRVDTAESPAVSHEMDHGHEERAGS